MSGPLPLTETQEKLWRFIRSCERSPTYQEMSDAIGYRVKGARVWEVADALEEKGYIRRTRNRARSIVALNPDADLTSAMTGDLIAELRRRGVAWGREA